MFEDPNYKTFRAMVLLYCRRRHGSKSGATCEECAELMEYAQYRLSKCPFGANKPTCQMCQIHCYTPEMRDRVKKVMRFSGPRMMLYHPVLAVRHLMQSRKSPKPAVRN